MCNCCPLSPAGVSYVKPRTSSQDTSTCSPDSATPSDNAHTPGNDDIQQHLSESFTKTVQEWERVREMRVREAGSPPVEGKIPEKRSRLKDRSKSRERDRSRHKYEKERQKIERKVVKMNVMFSFFDNFYFPPMSLYIYFSLLYTHSLS